MDVNNTPYFLLRGRNELRHGSRRLAWTTDREALTLAKNQSLRLPASDPAAGLLAWKNSTPLAIDRFNQLGRLSGAGTAVEFNSGLGFLPLQDGELKPVAALAGTFRDLALGGDGRLALPWSDGANQHGLKVFHLARRWQTDCALPAEPRRASVDVDNRVWCVSATRLMLCAGEPLPLPYTAEPSRFEPVSLNPHELGCVFGQALPAGLEALAVCADGERVYVLCHDGAGRQTVLARSRSERGDARLVRYDCAPDVPFAVDLAVAGPGRLAALAPKQTGDAKFARRDCPVLELALDTATGQPVARLVRERYPLLSLQVPRFVSSADGQLRYQADADPDFSGIDPRPRELHALRRPEYLCDADVLLDQVQDSGQPGTLWHRMYLDACIPVGCSLRIAVRVYDVPAEQGGAPLILQPAPLWNPLPSELPFADSLADSKPGESGLFEVLLQRPDGPVRRLSGRYLQIQVRFRGDGRHTPALHAIRVYYPRFSYQEAYLPELYRQELSYDPARAAESANGADVRERLLAAFEGMLTPLEGRLAATEQLVHPGSAPPEHLPWLAEVLGTALPIHWPLPRQRRLVRETTLVQQWKGTLAGVNLAMDIASDGGVQRGEIVLLENFRLRRTMATILGVDMDDGDHPLTLGTGMSGNSIVGDSLILSETDARTFLALFAPELATESEVAQVKAFFEDYAHQVSVLLHGRGVSLRPAVEAVLAEQLPAHLQWKIIETEHPFVLGIAPLLAVDTFLETTPEFRPVALDDTWLGREGVLKNPAAFSPRDINSTLS